MDKGEIVLYQPNDAVAVEVRLEEETVWLNRQQIAMLFGRDVKTIGKHINNIFSEDELTQEVVVANFATTTQHGAIKGKMQTISVEYYNLDVIISVGYRVKSKQGTQFRIWANKILKEYLFKGYAINNRMNRLEDNVEVLKNKVNEIDLQINTHFIPTQGVFFDGQIFDAYIFVSNLIKSANKSIILIDNWADETVLVMLSDRKPKVSAKIYTQRHRITEKLQLALAKHSQQYESVTIDAVENVHDRFLIIDNTVYAIGASMKDLGKRLFAFFKMEIGPEELLKNVCKLEENSTFSILEHVGNDGK